MARKSGGIFSRLKSVGERIFGRTEETRIPTPQPTAQRTTPKAPEVSRDDFDNESYVSHSTHHYDDIQYDDHDEHYVEPESKKKESTISSYEAYQAKYEAASHAISGVKETTDYTESYDNDYDLPPESTFRPTKPTVTVNQESVTDSYESYRAKREQILQQQKDAEEYKRKLAEHERAIKEARENAELKRLQQRQAEAQTYYEERYDDFQTQNETFAYEARMASNKETQHASIYTKEQVDIFYRTFQRVWEGGEPSSRNEAILSYVNDTIRIPRGELPLSLFEIMDKVLQANELALSAQVADPADVEDLDDYIRYDTLTGFDNEASDKTSPIMGTTIYAVRDNLDALLTMPKF